jgi:hypothetical protein
LQDGRIDAYFYTVGHPAGNIKEATAGARKVRIVPITGPGIDKLVADNPYYAKATVPISFYPGAANDADVETFGVKATFVTSAKVPENVVYAITKEVFDNFEDFKKLHPAYVVLTKANMLEGQSAPIHAGAEKYYKEAGLKYHTLYNLPARRRSPAAASKLFSKNLYQQNGFITLYTRILSRNGTKTPSQAQWLRCRPPTNAHIPMYAALSRPASALPLDLT